ncbi:MAG: 16S rRNA (cytidine(1402)-2'-O)-methyltransferase [Candidatus Comchoanobacterales bacterium]
MLYIVATPIGNRADASARMHDVLKQVDMIVAEHPDHTRRLLNQDLKGVRWVTIQDALEGSVASLVVRTLSEGKRVALVSDAGTPLISDPGYKVVRSAIDAGHQVSPIPGPSAVIAALSVSGLPTHQFFFSGFLPSAKHARKEVLIQLGSRHETSVFYESPHRIQDTLLIMREVLPPDRGLVICREMTKQFETFYHTNIASATQSLANCTKGEFVVVLAGKPREHVLSDQVKQFFSLMIPEVGKKVAIRSAVELFDVPKNLCYRWVEEHFDGQ